MEMTDLKYVSSDDSVADQNSKEDEPLEEPEERLFAAEDSLLFDKATLSRSSLAVVRHGCDYCRPTRRAISNNPALHFNLFSFPHT